MQITYIHCALKTEFEKKTSISKKKTFQGNIDNIYRAIIILIISDDSWCIHVDDLSIHQVFLTENPQGAPHDTRR